MKDYTVNDFSALIGIDWADQKHDVCEMAVGSGEYHSSVISSQPETLHDWAVGLKARYPNKPVAVACELKKGPLIYALSKYDHIVIFPINPITVAKLRKAFSHSGAKNDPGDAFIQAEILSLHMAKLTPIQPDSESVRALTQLVEYRRSLVQDRVKLTNRITSALKNYYPQLLDWFNEKDTIIFCDFLAKWSSLDAVKRARKQTLLKFFNQHNARYPDINEQRIQAIKSAQALTDDRGVIDPNRILVEALVPQLKVLIVAIDRIDQEIKTRYNAQNDHVIFDSLPGAGPQLAPRLLAAFGTDRNRFQSAAELQKYAGIAPVVEESGQKRWTHWRYSCPKFLRQTFVEWAGLSIRYSFWAKAYYELQISKGKHHNAAVRALAFKWIRIVFRCWQSNTPYNETTYLNALKDRGSPLLKQALSD